MWRQLGSAAWQLPAAGRHGDNSLSHGEILAAAAILGQIRTGCPANVWIWVWRFCQSDLESDNWAWDERVHDNTIDTLHNKFFVLLRKHLLWEWNEKLQNIIFGPTIIDFISRRISSTTLTFPELMGPVISIPGEQNASRRLLCGSLNIDLFLLHRRSSWVWSRNSLNNSHGGLVVGIGALSIQHCNEAKDWLNLCTCLVTYKGGRGMEGCKGLT